MEVILWLLQKTPPILQFISMRKSLQPITIHIQAHQLSPINSMMVELSGSTITLSQDHHQEPIPSHKLYGSNDGENWVILDEQSSISFSTSETKYFSLRSNPRSYKLKITSEVDLADWQGYSAIYANP